MVEGTEAEDQVSQSQSLDRATGSVKEDQEIVSINPDKQIGGFITHQYSRLKNSRMTYL
jgi:transposase-like protein